MNGRYLRPLVPELEEKTVEVNICLKGKQTKGVAAI